MYSERVLCDAGWRCDGTQARGAIGNDGCWIRVMPKAQGLSMSRLPLLSAVEMVLIFRIDGFGIDAVICYRRIFVTSQGIQSFFLVQR